MNCFGCFSSIEKKKSASRRPPRPVSPSPSSNHPSFRHRQESNSSSKLGATRSRNKSNTGNGEGVNGEAQIFTFQELASATKNFAKECLVGEGGFGRVYKGVVGKTGQIAAIKQLDRGGLQGNREFLVEAMMLSLLHHENLVNLIGYCTDGDQRILVYEYMERGSLEDHLFDLPPGKKPLDWLTRMKIAFGAAKGVEYLHYKANPSVIYRDLKSSNILLDQDFKAKLSDFGLAKLVPQEDKSHVSSKVMGTYGYCAPEYLTTGQFTVKSDVYSFGVVLLELITGRMAVDGMRPEEEQNVVTWAYPILRDPPRYLDLVDPRLHNAYPLKGLHQAVAVAAMCLDENASGRPTMSEIVNSLSYFGSAESEENRSEDTGRSRSGRDDSGNYGGCLLRNSE